MWGTKRLSTEAVCMVGTRIQLPLTTPQVSQRPTTHPDIFSSCKDTVKALNLLSSLSDFSDVEPPPLVFCSEKYFAHVVQPRTPRYWLEEMCPFKVHRGGGARPPSAFFLSNVHFAFILKSGAAVGRVSLQMWRQKHSKPLINTKVTL